MINSSIKNFSGPFGIILLAAGSSSRLGKPKQLIIFEGKSLLQHGLQVAIDTGIGPVVTVLGANADLVSREVENQAVLVAINENWKEGMASSVRKGLQRLLNMAPETNAAIIMVCDQPFVTTKLLIDLVKKYQQTGKPIIASSYDNILGTPALFDKTIFAGLLELKGDTGAKKIIKENPDWVESVNFPLGKIDIDTEADYEGLPQPPEKSGQALRRRG